MIRMAMTIMGIASPNITRCCLETQFEQLLLSER